MRHSQQTTFPGKSGRQGESAVGVVAAVAGFALLLGGVLLLRSSSPTPEAVDVVVETAGLDSPSPTAVAAASPTGPAKAAAPTGAVADSSAESGVNELQPAERVESQLSAGEFGPALETALAVAAPQEQAELLKRIADAQMAQGDFAAALAVIRRIPVAGERDSARGERAEKLALAGGSGADFQSLIDLIQQETSGPWEEIDGDGGTVTEYETGVRVDPNGLLARLSRQELNGRLESLGVRARHADLNEDMARPSNLRLVSLTRLEKQVRDRLAAGQSVVETMKHLAGLTQIQYLFVYPEAGEIVVAGPAEGWRYNENGLPVGVESGKPTLQLDDFVTVLRTFQPGGDAFFNCLIVPRPEKLQALEAYVHQTNSRGPLRAGSGVRAWVQKLEEILGEQDVVVNGVPLDSRVARVIVEADYRMKLIGIDKLEAEDIPSYFDILPQTGEAAPSATIGLRWWMTMKYDAILHSADRNVFEVQGSSVLCQSEDEMITSDGQRVHTGKSSPANSQFAQKFTERFQHLAQRDIVFADMHNIFDLALVAALIRHEKLDEQIDWNGGTFAAGGDYRPARFAPPKSVMTVANHRVYNGKDIVVQVAGGVRADLMSVVANAALRQAAPRLGQLAEHARAGELPAGRWWWDVAAQ